MQAYITQRAILNRYRRQENFLSFDCIANIFLKKAKLFIVDLCADDLIGFKVKFIIAINTLPDYSEIKFLKSSSLEECIKK